MGNIPKPIQLVVVAGIMWSLSLTISEVYLLKITRQIFDKEYNLKEAWSSRSFDFKDLIIKESFESRFYDAAVDGENEDGRPGLVLSPLPRKSGGLPNPPFGGLSRKAKSISSEQFVNLLQQNNVLSFEGKCLYHKILLRYKTFKVNSMSISYLRLKKRWYKESKGQSFAPKVVREYYKFLIEEIFGSLENRYGHFLTIWK